MKTPIDILRDEQLHDVNDTEKVSLEKWSHLTSDNRKFHRLMNEMRLSSEVEEKKEEMKSDIRQELNRRIRRSKYIYRIRRISAAAAFVMMLLGITSYLSYQEGAKQINPSQIEVFNPLGRLSTVTLPDGSKVTLNAGTTLSYPQAFVAKNREVSMKGEAFFEVVHDAKHPFIVKADEISVKVLGTQFNVKAYEKDDRIEVSLEEGKVEVQSEQAKSSVFLVPSEQACYHKHRHSLTMRKVNLTYYTSWKKGAYYFRALPLKEITKQLERIFNVRILITSADIENIIFTGEFLRGENVEQILRIITADNRLKYRMEEGAIYIDAN